jgi:hypothetical protein
MKRSGRRAVLCYCGCSLGCVVAGCGLVVPYSFLRLFVGWWLAQAMAELDEMRDNRVEESQPQA